MDDKRYTLMNKNRPVLDFLYNLDTHHVVKILKRRELDFAPPAILDMKGNPTRAALDVWWLRRAIPASRAQIQRLIAELHVDSTLALAEKNFGLSLSDRYWINDPENPQNWDDINFIENQPSFHRLTPAAAKTKEPNTPDFLDSEVADMKDASAKLLCDSNSEQPSKNLHTEH